ncbi:hypothetical protein ACFUIW_25270 [Streptomyces sp. NPDC057245]|uniref:hypothetical protein n=1 Tax=Streptomyces TaxID=1883 RepID=UPI001C1E23F5|nr:hypothetical protein [Streptomyces sp. A108]MBU6530184.1 hypothetical protein [Streptomyces sp. A108]
MDVVISALIAIAGTLLGSTVTHAFQRKASAQDQLFAAQQQLRSDRMTVYSDFAGALTEFRRGQQDRWHRRNEDPDGSAFIEARTEAYRLRGIALHALFRVQLIASARTLIDTAQDAYDLTSALHKASDRTELSAVGAQAREVLEQFIKLASSDVQ